MAAMLLPGRLEVLTVLVVFAKAFGGNKMLLGQNGCVNGTMAKRTRTIKGAGRISLD